ncbi:anthranilate synthase / indole-3-glycerol phosphate synthase [Vermiconidia calcicola]|uniref:Anthranilate synthase / indole-3-glycerol phosphate synthase n=1 Tax=Vermiconidia calcicola TaxID=1690605 RepID=A0ACC3MW86_9PEZI|nr:anthranilate synthase / indole-3-glycerol phosphate synthase [Vermiconidia calcicola]
MVNDEQLRNLRVLAKKYRIRLKSQSEKWPPAHQATFQCIRNLSQYTFEAYKNTASANSASEPWKAQTLARAEWIVERATTLSNTLANSSEFSWRMHLENDILERFVVEVACPKCKHRLWRSDIESVHQDSSRAWDEVDQRKLKREPCKCSEAERPLDK